MEEAKDDLKLSRKKHRREFRSASVSGIYLSQPLSSGSRVLSSSQNCVSCGKNCEGLTDHRLLFNSNQSRMSCLQRNSLFSSQKSNSEVDISEGVSNTDAEGEERENGYPLVADFPLLNICRSSESIISESSISFARESHTSSCTGNHNVETAEELCGNDFTDNSIYQNATVGFSEVGPTISKKCSDFMIVAGSSNTALNNFKESNNLNSSSNSSIFRPTCNEYQQNQESVPGKDNAAYNLTSEEPKSTQKLNSIPENTKKSHDLKSSGSLKKPSNSLTHGFGWQATKASLKERVSFMCCNDLLADVYFLVGHGENQKRFPAHKFILVTGSTVFDKMFNGELTKTSSDTKINELGKEEIELPDVEPSAFVALLKFLYSDDVCIGPDNVMTTLYTAKKYSVPALEKACVEFLKHNLSSENAFMLLTQALLFDEHSLTEMCLEVIDRNTLEALNAEGNFFEKITFTLFQKWFLEIDLDTLCMVLVRETLRIREAPLFLAVLRWSLEQCKRRGLAVIPENQRQVLGRAVYLIRFPLMTVDEFAQHVAMSGILTDHEVVNIFVYFSINPKPETIFSTTPRCCVFGKEVVVSRFQRVESRWGYSGTPDRIKFTVDKRIFVLGFGLHGSIHGPHEYSVTIQIIHSGSGKVLASNDTFFTCDGSSSTFRVMFKEPVEIAPCVTYIASARLKGPDSHYGTKGLRRIVHQSPSSGVVTFQFTYAAGNNNGTSVEDGQIPEIIFCTKIN